MGHGPWAQGGGGDGGGAPVSGWSLGPPTHLLVVLALGMHAVDNAGVLRLERTHIVLSRFDCVLLRQLIPVVGPLLLLLHSTLAHLLLLITDGGAELRVLLARPLDLVRRCGHLRLLLILVVNPPRPIQLLLLQLEAAALLALFPRVVSLRMVAIWQGRDTARASVG
jgi:hypothetical protein